MHTEEKISSKQIFKGRVIDVYDDRVRLEDGSEAGREWVSHKGGVCVLALDDDNCIYLVRQFRYPYGKELLELPAGKRDSEEAPIDCAKRELEEEVGITAEDWTFLGEMYPSPGYTAEIIYLYLARDLKETHRHPDEDEFLDIERIPYAMALSSVMENKIKDAKTCVAILRLQESMRKIGSEQ